MDLEQLKGLLMQAQAGQAQQGQQPGPDLMEIIKRRMLDAKLRAEQQARDQAIRDRIEASMRESMGAAPAGGSPAPVGGMPPADQRPQGLGTLRDMLMWKAMKESGAD